jgi:hypothetical protein
MSFVHKDISEAAAREELATKYGRLATPTLVIGDKIFLGFKQNREEIEKIINSIIRGDNV